MNWWSSAFRRKECCTQTKKEVKSMWSPLYIEKMTISSEYLHCAITKSSACRNKRHPALGNNPTSNCWESTFFFFFFNNSIPASSLWLLFLGRKKKAGSQEKLRTVHCHSYQILKLKKEIRSKYHPANRLANIQIPRWSKDSKYSFCNKIQRSEN